MSAKDIDWTTFAALFAIFEGVTTLFDSLTRCFGVWSLVDASLDFDLSRTADSTRERFAGLARGGESPYALRADRADLRIKHQVNVAAMSDVDDDVDAADMRTDLVHFAEALQAGEVPDDILAKVLGALRDLDGDESSRAAARQAGVADENDDDTSNFSVLHKQFERIAELQQMLSELEASAPEMDEEELAARAALAELDELRNRIDEEEKVIDAEK